MVINRLHTSRLASPLFIRLRERTETLALEVVDEDMDFSVGRRLYFVHRTVAAEYFPAFVFVVDMAAHRHDLVTRAGIDRDIDPAIVIAVDQHGMRIRGTTNRVAD